VGTLRSAVASSPLDDFREAFEAKGYLRLPAASSDSTGDMWYRFEASSENAIHLANLQYKPIARAYGVRLAAFNPDAQRLVKSALPLILRYLHPSFAGNRAKYFDRPHWLLFDVGRALQWPLLAVPNPFARDTWPSQLQELLDKFLEPTFWKVKSIPGLQELLFRNEAPFEWSASGPVIRAAEIIALAKVAKSDTAAIKRKLLDFRQTITAGMHGSTDCEGMLDQFFERIGQ